MDHQIYILVIEDELEVMDALIKDLEEFEQTFPIESANNAEEAEQVVKSIADSGDEIGLILCDHVLPGKNGVEFLIELESDKKFGHARKVLVTGQAGLEDTIQAINKAHLDHYIAKPWNMEEFQKVVIDQLTGFVIEKKYNPMEFMAVLDSVRLAEALRGSKLTDH
ncbi:MAG: response regulator [Balneolaceae bacterium]|nr:response regulator [Balneolaceae bacterium]MBO6545835.1 response regulator [Balneolaceae bacterium]MBO6647231.1 response regulator [Balneolaceae bacterium]